MAPKPPGSRSLPTTPLMTMPYRSSSDSALACSRLVGSVSPGGTRDQRPLTVGGPVCDGSAPRPNPGRLVSRPAAGPRWLAYGDWSPCPPDGCTCPFGRPFGVPAPTANSAALAAGPGPDCFGPGAQDLPVASRVRSGASVSLVSMPAQTRSQIAAA